jgi:hypothetical protein
MSASALLGARVGDRAWGGLDESVDGKVDDRVDGKVDGRVDGAPRHGEVRMPPELLADLYEPHLIITADYVGPDPRYVDWDRLRREAGAGAPLRHAFSARMLEILVVVLVTGAVIVPITLIASQAVRGAPSPQPTTRVISAPPPSAPLSSAAPSSAPLVISAGRSANPASPNSSGATPVAAGAAAGPNAQGANDRRAERAQSAADRRAERIARHAARARWHGSSAMVAPAGH